MRIVILDDVRIGRADISRLEERGEVVVYEGNPATTAEVIARAKGAEVLISGWTEITQEVLAALPGLQLVSLWATGVDKVDVDAASRLGVAVCNVPSYATTAVAELTFGLMLAVMRKIPSADKTMRATGVANWRSFLGSELCGKTLGLVGTGLIGGRVARFGYAFGMGLVGYDAREDAGLIADTALRYAPLSELFLASDVISLHLPLTSDTRHIVDATALRTIRRTAIIINTARSGLIDQDALYEALASGEIAGAGLDVVDSSRESGRALLALDNVVVTPHIGFFTAEALDKLTSGCVNNVLHFLDGEPVNVVTEGPAGAGAAHETTMSSGPGDEP